MNKYYSEFEHFIVKVFEDSGYKTIYNEVDDSLDADDPIKKQQILSNFNNGDGITLGSAGAFLWDSKENAWINRSSPEYSNVDYYILSANSYDWHDLKNVWVVPKNPVKFYFSQITSNWHSLPRSGDKGRQLRLQPGDNVYAATTWKKKMKFQDFIEKGCVYE